MKSHFFTISISQFLQNESDPDPPPPFFSVKYLKKIGSVDIKMTPDFCS